MSFSGMSVQRLLQSIAGINFRCLKHCRLKRYRASISAVYLTNQAKVTLRRPKSIRTTKEDTARWNALRQRAATTTQKLFTDSGAAGAAVCDCQWHTVIYRVRQK